MSESQPETQIVISRAYAAFNTRDIDSALAVMSDRVHWPKASEGGYVVGKKEVRAYWTRQWEDFDPHVEPVEIIQRGDGKTDVRVHQVVKSLAGEVLFDGEVWHTYAITDGRIKGMELKGTAEGEDSTPSAAFARR